MSERATRTGWLLLPLVLAFVVAACSNEECPTCASGITTPTDTVSFYLGYSNDTLGITTCGGCHATFQAGWETTGHSEAWETLQASGHAQEFCEGCHTTNQLGNRDTQPAGWLASKDPSYLDVQCENCHSSGFDHITDPTATQPLATIAVDSVSGCGECHNGEHHPFVEQWSESEHGQATSNFAAGWEGCNHCHEGRMALLTRFFSNSNYIEKFEGPDSIQPIVCAVCHSPHGSDFEANLRAPIATATTDHLCIRCHANRGTPPSTHGPHAAQGLLVLGTDIGWIPSGFVDPGAHAHGDEVVNPEVCITCHVNQYAVADSAGGFVFQNVGHLFEAIPCLDAAGIPTEGPCDNADRDWSACAECHSSATVAQALYEGIWDELNVLLDSLWFDSNGNDTLDASDAGLLPMVVAQGDTTELDPSDDIITVAEGTLWNAQIAYTDDRPWWGGGTVFGVDFSAHRTSANGVHNPDWLVQILEASIDATIARYGL